MLVQPLVPKRESHPHWLRTSLSEEQKARLRELSDQTKRPMTDLVRLAVDRLLSDQERARV